MFSIDYTQVIIGYFQAIGLSSAPSSSATSNDRLLLIVIIFNAVALIIASIIMYVYAPLIFYINDTDIIGSLTDIIQIAGIYAAHYVMLIESRFTNRMRKNIWKSYERIDRRLSVILKIDINSERKRAMRSYAWKALAIHGGCFAIEVRVMTYVTENEPWSRHWYLSIYTMIVCRSMHLFYMLFVDMLRLRMDIIANELKKLSGGMCGGGFTTNVDIEQTIRLALLKETHNSLWMISEGMRKSFGWSELMNITANFVCSAINLYWNYTALYFGTNPWWRESLIASVPLFVILATLCHSSESCHSSVSAQNERK